MIKIIARLNKAPQAGKKLDMYGVTAPTCSVSSSPRLAAPTTSVVRGSANCGMSREGLTLGGRRRHEAL